MTDQRTDRVEVLGQLIQKHEQDRLLLVADPLAFQHSGAEERLRPILAQTKVQFFSNFEPNPKLEQAIEGAKLLANDSCDLVVAIGGGTALDMAKLICCLAAQPNKVSQPEEFLSQLSNLQSRHHPLIAIPTTAGTGSEATLFAAAYVENVKHSVSHSSLIPDEVILDPTLTYSVPTGTTVATALDAVSQAIESIWSVQATDESIHYAEQALKLGLVHLVDVATNPQPTSRAAMLQAAHLAGKAINISRTTASHALSYTMTIQHQVPHGIAVALSLAPFIRFNARVTQHDVADSRGLSHVQSIFKRLAKVFQINPESDKPMDAIANRWEELLDQIGVARQLTDWGIKTPEQRANIAQSVNHQRLGNNPRTVTEQQLREIVEAIA